MQLQQYNFSLNICERKLKYHESMFFKVMFIV